MADEIILEGLEGVPGKAAHAQGAVNGATKTLQEASDFAGTVANIDPKHSAAIFERAGIPKVMNAQRGQGKGGVDDAVDARKILASLSATEEGSSRDLTGTVGE